jgi:hypothetical protein
MSAQMMFGSPGSILGHIFLLRQSKYLHGPTSSDYYLVNLRTMYKPLELRRVKRDKVLVTDGNEPAVAYCKLISMPIKHLHNVTLNKKIKTS